MIKPLNGNVQGLLHVTLFGKIELLMTLSHLFDVFWNSFCLPPYVNVKIAL